MVAKRERFRSGQEAQLDGAASLSTADRELFSPKRRAGPPRGEPEGSLTGAQPDEPVSPPAAGVPGLGRRHLLELAQRAQLDTPAVLSLADRTLIARARLGKRARLQALQQAQLETPSRLGRAERMLVRHTCLARRHRFRSAQMAQLDVPSVLAEVDRILLVGTEKAPAPQVGLDRRQRLQALQRAQLEAPVVLGRAERVLLGQARLYHRHRLRSAHMAQLDRPSVLTEADRILHAGARRQGWRQRLRSIGQGLAVLVDSARIRLKMPGTGVASKGAAGVEGPATVRGPVEGSAAVPAGPTWREQTGAAKGLAVPPTSRRQSEAALILASAFGSERLAEQVPIVTAALTELGAPRDEFGLMLKVGSLLPKAQGRTSEFTVTGVALAELSHGLSRWLKEAGKTDIPLQVIDDGSGKIRVLMS